MQPLVRGRYTARLAGGPGDLAAALGLRALAFPADRGDPFDAVSAHVLVERADAGAGAGPVCTFRLRAFAPGDDLDGCYSARFYDLAPLARRGVPLVEVGRFCTRPGAADADVLRIALGAMARFVDDHAAAMLFGCASFAGTRVAPYGDCFAFLRAGRLAPADCRPGRRAPEVHAFARASRHAADRRAALAAMPPLLRSYLALGAWVSDHAVIDRAFGTLHVLTGLEIAAIPPARARSLRAIAAGPPPPPRPAIDVAAAAR